jgi:outer membrane protein OmpA-like peptidoglycan-associated protein
MRNLLFGLLLLSATAASTVARANDIELGVLPSVPVGKQPTLTIKVKKDLASGQLELKNTGGGSHRQPLKETEAGNDIVIQLPHSKVGKVKWSGSLSVVFADKSEGSMPVSFSTEVLGSFRFSIKDEDIDLVNHSIIVTSERDTAKIELEVYTDEGALLAGTSKEFDKVKAGTPMKLEWSPRTAGDVLRLHVVVTDTATATQSGDWFPYTVSIPHEDVEFETGKDAVRPSEEPKLKAAIAEIDKALKRFGPALQADKHGLRLMVTGHTDTVGNAAGNKALSDRRAQSIAKWFARAGVKVPIYARGMGEDDLKVDTPDETENQSNRRVDYDVGAGLKGAGVPGWTRVN